MQQVRRFYRMWHIPTITRWSRLFLSSTERVDGGEGGVVVCIVHNYVRVRSSSPVSSSAVAFCIQVVSELWCHLHLPSTAILWHVLSNKSLSKLTESQADLYFLQLFNFTANWPPTYSYITHNQVSTLLGCHLLALRLVSWDAVKFVIKL